MAVEYEQFLEMITRAEDLALQRPWAFRLRLSGFALLGLLYIYIILALLLGVLGIVLLTVILGPGAQVQGAEEIFAIALALGCAYPFGLFAYLIVKAVGVSPSPPPHGVAITSDATPRLHALIDDLCGQLQAPRPHTVLLTGDFCISVVSHPRLGVFGSTRRYLLIGLPVLGALSPAQFRACLAQAFAQPGSGRDGLAAWAFRLGQVWFPLPLKLDEPTFLRWVLSRSFFHWLVPRLIANTVVMSRLGDFHALQDAAAAAGRQELIDALLALAVMDRHLDASFWSGMDKRNEANTDAPADLFTTLYRVMRDGAPPDQAAGYLSAALEEATRKDAAEFALADHLSILDYFPAREGGVETLAQIAAKPPAETAGEHFLGDALPSLATALDRVWADFVQPQWRERHEFMRRMTERRQELTAKTAEQDVNEQEAWEYATATAVTEGESASIPLLQRVLAMNPDHVSANFTLGRLLLEQQDPGGIGYLEHAMSQDPWCVPEACGLVIHYLEQRGHATEAELYRKRGMEHMKVLPEADRERTSLAVKDTFLSHKVADEYLETVRNTLARHPNIVRAYLIRKQVAVFPEIPCHYLICVVSNLWTVLGFSGAVSQAAGALSQELDLPVRLYIYCIGPGGPGQEIEAKLRKIEGARVYMKSR